MRGRKSAGKLEWEKIRENQGKSGKIRKMCGGNSAGKLEWGKVRENERGETQKYAAFESYAPLPSDTQKAAYFGVSPLSSGDCVKIRSFLSL